MIVEVRTYTTEPGRRADFLAFFERRAMPAQRAAGMQVLGPFVDCEHPDRFVWLRGFPSLAERDRLKEAFYEGDVWKGELEAIAMPMLAAYSVVVTETTSAFAEALAAFNPGA
jgi:hypothetical protein